MKTFAMLSLLFATTFVSAQQVLPLWPHGAPEAPMNQEAEVDLTKPSSGLINGHTTVRLTNVSNPTLTVYAPPADKNTGTAALVLPGGGYSLLALTGEGNDVCDWLNSVGVTCLLVKYRVPQPKGEAGHYPQDFADLEDAQQAMRIAKAHARDWKIDVKKIGVVGFSAGGNLAILLATHPDDHHIESTAAARDIPGYTQETSGAIRITGQSDASPAFTIAAYPAYLALADDPKTLNPVYTPNSHMAPTFLIAAEDDSHYGFNSPLYYQALTEAKVPAELHMYATGGHGFGVRPPNKPEEHWTHLANIWLRGLGFLPPPVGHHVRVPAATVEAPSPVVSGAASNCPPGTMPSGSTSGRNGRPGAANSSTNNNVEQPCVP